MMTKFLAQSYTGIIELFMWLIMLTGIGAGIGAEFTNHLFYDGLIGFLIAIFLTAFFFGPILILIEIKKVVANIEKRVVSDSLPSNIDA